MPYADKTKQIECVRRFKQKRRDDWIASKGGKCAEPSCHATENLQIDHVEPTDKNWTIHWGASVTKLAKELEKCQPLCEAHHKAKTLRERQNLIPHGTRSGYVNHQCRCKPCTDANRGYFSEKAKLVHGTRNAYQYHGCRCNICRTASAHYAANYRRTRRIEQRAPQIA